MPIISFVNQGISPRATESESSSLRSEPKDALSVQQKKAILQFVITNTGPRTGRKSPALLAAITQESVVNHVTGINPHHSRQVAAANRLFLKIVTDAKYTSLQNVEDRYEALLAAPPKRKGNQDTAKDALLARKDPLVPLPEGAAKALDFVLANIHFEAPASGAQREEARQALQEEFTRLAQQPYTKSVLAAFAALIKREKGQILFAEGRGGLGKLGEKYANTISDAQKRAGIYVGNHSVYVTNPIVQQ